MFQAELLALRVLFRGDEPGTAVQNNVCICVITPCWFGGGEMQTQMCAERH